MNVRGKKTTPPKKGGRGCNFSAVELDTLLTLVEKSLPMGADQWEYLTLEFNKSVSSDRARDMESLRKKFKNLKNKKKPTGDPDCPIEVKRAKRAHYQIESRMSVENMGSESEEETGDNEDEDEADEEEKIEDMLCNETSLEEDDNTSLFLPVVEDDNNNTTSAFGTEIEADCSTNAKTKSQSKTGSTVIQKNTSNPVGASRTGMTMTELHHAARRNNNTTPSPALSASSATKKSIDAMIGQMQNDRDVDLNQQGGRSLLAEYMMITQMEERRRDERERATALERERNRREDLRLQEERDERREEAQRRHEESQMKMMMMFMSSFQGQSNNKDKSTE